MVGPHGSPGNDRAAQIERQLAAAQQITHIGSWEWDARTNAVSWSDELYRIYGLEPREREITLDYFLSRLHPEDRDRIQREIGAALERGGRFAYVERIVLPDGSVRYLDTVGEVALEDGRAVGLLGTCRDVTAERRREQLAAADLRVLEMIATAAPLGETLAALVRAIEDYAPGTLGSVLLLDPDGVHLRHGAAPSLPDVYNRAIHGAAIGPNAGSCGSAAYHRRPIIVEDIETDPLWAPYRELARPHGLRACWSQPILTTSGRVLGTFALYYRTPKRPDDTATALIARATYVAKIAIERRELEDQLRALTAHAESIREEERTGIAREIHDELGQALTALKMDMAWASRRLRADQVGEVIDKLGSMASLTDEIIHVVRRISAELRPGVLDDLGLAAALEWQAHELERRTGTTCSVRSTVGDIQIDRAVGTAIFRAFQEALTNVVRHAKATRVDVRLDLANGCLRLEVQDDGGGISAGAIESPVSLGLLGIRERARRLGGHATVRRAEPRGTLVQVSVPLSLAPMDPVSGRVIEPAKEHGA